MFFIVLILSTTSCIKEREGFDGGGPISRHLSGTWQLEKVVTPSGAKVGSQIGYTEIIETGNDGRANFDKVFKNDSLIATYGWLRSPFSSSSSDMTVTVSYDNWTTRHFKIRLGPDRITIETSGYVSEIGSVEDSVRYHYVRVK